MVLSSSIHCSQTNAQKSVRILLLGDRGVGKTSLILSLVSDEYAEDVPNKAEEITIPADITPEQVPTRIVDYSAVEQSEDQLCNEIMKAHVICIVYSVEDRETLENAKLFWLPLVRNSSSNKKCPVVLVGNKIDVIDYSTIEDVYPIMKEFSEIESCIECSAKTLQNISEMFYYAQKAVLHPTLPLYNYDSQELTNECKVALERIFKICDVDNDGLLCDTELNAFQQWCFNTPLQPQVLEDVKAVLSKNIEDGVKNGCVTVKGFMFLQCLFIQRGRNETTWAVLRKFGYDNELKMSKDYIHPPFKVPIGCTTELSYKGQEFLTQLFNLHDKDNDGALSPVELESLFSKCPVPPWGEEYKYTVTTTKENWITYQGYMCEWAFITYTNVKKTLEYLAYLGYNLYHNENSTTAIAVTRDKKLDLAKMQSIRTVYCCHIIGPRNSGKSTLCKTFIDPKHEKLNNDASCDLHVTVNTVHVYGQEKTIILRDINVRNVQDALTPAQIQCDVAALIYDVNNPKSFEYIARIYIKYFAESKIPVLIIANKCDLTETKQEYLLQPSRFCSKYNLISPQFHGIKNSVSCNIFVKLATMAAFPHVKQFRLLRSNPDAWWKTGIGIAVATLASIIIFKIFSIHRR